ncbi:Hypothetical protein Bdt_2575 [Bdellovibrio bacteriovorus str. Tiberius]|uniref:Uncharacterized protein n=1 Tax=Bdellovibrio bacteriovorus str. Tiberius TaxID=1069642 RepID=K7YX51_BDEBC|nr:Hypothetical protein Bdt_2575 [Bdellovibrio bacteriovorus str. Tiberius]
MLELTIFGETSTFIFAWLVSSFRIIAKAFRLIVAFVFYQRSIF